MHHVYKAVYFPPILIGNLIGTYLNIDDYVHEGTDVLHGHLITARNICATLLFESKKGLEHLSQK